MPRPIVRTGFSALITSPTPPLMTCVPSLALRCVQRMRVVCPQWHSCAVFNDAGVLLGPHHTPCTTSNDVRGFSSPTPRTASNDACSFPAPAHHPRHVQRQARPMHARWCVGFIFLPSLANLPPTYARRCMGRFFLLSTVNPPPTHARRCVGDFLSTSARN
jgi:hypothetical protein